MVNNDLLSQGVNGELRTPSANGEDENFNEDNQDEDLDENDLEDDQDDEDQIDEEEFDTKKISKPNRNQEKAVKSNLHKTITGQNRKISELQKELDSIKNSKSISDEDLEKIKSKYDEEDLEIIEKIIERKSNDLMDRRASNSLEQRELNILLKKYPDLEDSEIKHIKSLQKDFGYSLQKAHSIIFGRNVDTPQRKNPSISNSFGGDNGSRNSNSQKGNDESKAYKDMDAFM